MNTDNKELDEILFSLIMGVGKTSDKVLYEQGNLDQAKQSIQNLIDRKCREARIDELERALEHSDVHTDLVTGLPYRKQYIQKRIKALESGTADTTGGKNE